MTKDWGRLEWCLVGVIVGILWGLAVVPVLNGIQGGLDRGAFMGCLSDYVGEQ